MTQRILMLVGTRKGGFILESDASRERWEMRGTVCDGWPIHDLTWDPATSTIYGAGGSPWYGPAVFRSTDLGRTWTHSSEGLTYGEGGPTIRTVWNVTPSAAAVYAGVEPAGLFRSEDRGETWQHVEGLTNHPTRSEWQPGAGGLCLHSIVVHPTDPQRLWVGISSVGAFSTTDGGATWSTRNVGVRAGFQPDIYPEFGQCVHKLVMASGRPDRLFQQNHCGVYRSDDSAATWTEITTGLPSEFGFPMATHPRDDSTVWTIPLNGAELGRFVPDAAAAVWRTRDAGANWQRLGEGLPQSDAYLTVLREAMASDRLDPAGVYFGTESGHVYASNDEGERWSLIADNLPAVWSVDTVVLDG